MGEPARVLPCNEPTYREAVQMVETRAKFWRQESWRHQRAGNWTKAFSFQQTAERDEQLAREMADRIGT